MTILTSQKYQVKTVTMRLLLQFFSFFSLLSLSRSESKGPRSSVCNSDNKGFLPAREHGPRPHLDEEEYNVTISLRRDKDNQIVNCVEDKTRYTVIINATKYFKGFIITSTEPGVGYPANFVGRFARAVHEYSTENLVWACDNTISHSDILKKNPVYLKWRSASGSREVEFLYAVVFSRYVWLANLTTRFPACKPPPKLPKCIKRVDTDSSGSGPTNITTAIGSAQLENKCVPVRTALKPLVLNIPIANEMITFHCTGHTLLCRGKCVYCDQTCQSVTSKMEKPQYICKTEADKYITEKIIRYRPPDNWVQVDQECKCGGKHNKSES